MTLMRQGLDKGALLLALERHLYCRRPAHPYNEDPTSSLDLTAKLNSVEWLQLEPGARYFLDRLRKKIEVARTLFRFYLPDLSKAVARAPLAPFEVERLCVLLIKAALVWNDLRYLNSALKLLDGVLERDDCKFSDDLRVLARAAMDVLLPLPEVGQ